MLIMTPYAPPADCLWDFNARIARMRSTRYRQPTEDALKMADRLDTEGREAFLRFMEEYRINCLWPRKGNPVVSLQRNRVTRRPDVHWEITGKDVSGQPGALPYMDHNKWMRDQDGMLVVTSNPYHEAETLEPVCVPFAEANGLRVDIRPDLDFYSRFGNTPLVVWRKAGREETPR